MSKKIPIAEGDRYGMLTVLREGEPVGAQKQRAVIVRCDCGTEKQVRLGELRNGKTVSCGCHRLKILRAGRAPQHGESHHNTTVEYKTWDGIIQRCTNPKCGIFHRYGGRGISVCHRWLTYENFLEDMGRRPDDCSIERLNNSGDYEPDNCVWADRRVQQNNKRTNLRYTINGTTQTLAQWCRQYRKNYHTIWRRVKGGKTIEEALDLTG